MATSEKIEQTTKSLERVQKFDVQTLVRQDQLGQALCFAEITSHAQSIVDLYKRISIACLDDFADQQLDSITTQANSDNQLFEKILAFMPTDNNANQQRISLIESVTNRRDQLFNILWQYIAYSVARVTDTTLLETQARATIQAIKDQATDIQKHLNANKKESDDVLKAIKSVAAEQGVSQQATYFKDEFDTQETKAEEWLRRTYYFSVAIAGFAVASLFLHKWEWLAPKTDLETVQFVSSKIIIFSVLAFLLLMSSRNYGRHKHNAVLNKHRQNALLTYQALVKAAGEKGTEDIVLANAASCIFSPQDTGYTFPSASS